jgi:hypothetical protein
MPAQAPASNRRTRGQRGGGRRVGAPDQPRDDEQDADQAEERHGDVIARKPAEVDENDARLPRFPLVRAGAAPREQQRREQGVPR